MITTSATFPPQKKTKKSRKRKTGRYNMVRDYLNAIIWPIRSSHFKKLGPVKIIM